ncbi:MAG: hypothetical protein LPK47_03285 [Bacteroidota bacterium]|nr:hypothetical protein [Bacteroidota bacterium]
MKAGILNFQNIFTTSKNKYSNLIFLVGLFVLGGLSWKYYQPYNSPLLDGDKSIWIAIANKPHFPDGLYYWGQDRLGSLIPILSHVLAIIGISPILGLSIVNLGIQGLTSSIIFRISNSIFIGWIVGIFLLIPPWTFQPLNSVAQPYTTQVLVLALFLLFTKENNIIKFRNGLLLSLILGLGIWVSESSIALLFPISFYLWRNHKRNHSNYYGFAIGLIVSITLINILKNNVTRSNNYHTMIKSITEMNESFLGIYNLLNYYWSTQELKLLSIFIIVISTTLAGSYRAKRISMYILQFGIALTLITLLSGWVSKNPFNQRYFALPIFIIILGYLVGLEFNLKWKRVLSLCLLLCILWISIIPFGYISSSYRPTRDRPTRLEITNILQNITYPLVGDYWGIYLALGLKNSLIVTEKDYWLTRNKWDREKVINSDTIQLLDFSAPERFTLDKENYIIESINSNVGPYKLSTYIKDTID